MNADTLIDRILGDESLTDGLADPEARLLVEWLVEKAEGFAKTAPSPAEAGKQVEFLCKKARTIKRFVLLWCERQDQGAAAQLAASERVHWPMPEGGQVDPVEVMQTILEWENGHMAARAAKVAPPE